MDANGPVEIHTTNSFAEAEILRNALRAEGIKCELEGENQGSLAGVLAIRILVRALDADRARHMLASHRPGHKGAES
jgi:hypothetical protein